MPIAYVVHAESDDAFVRGHLLPSLPSNGYDRWLTSRHVAGSKPDEQALALAMDQCQVILVVLSSALLRAPDAVHELGVALARRGPVIGVQTGILSLEEAALLPPRAGAVPRVDFTLEEEGEALPLLAALLPMVEPADTVKPAEAVRIEWDEDIFSRALVRATKRHDHSRAESLVRAVVGHLAHSASPCLPRSAYRDLQALRQEREFELMLEYGNALLTSGTSEARVKRLYAQALIETGRYDAALDVLQSIAGSEDSSRAEVFEAQGLIGRTFKQRYVELPKAPSAADWLHKAISAYEAVYVQDRKQFWHGVNAASCILRAQRDGLLLAPPGRAQQIALQIVDDLDAAARTGALAVWDLASRVEALLALERYDEARPALDAYIHHPDMTAFEASSTFRQFDQVLQLGQSSRGRELLAQLRGAVERYRAGRIDTGRAGAVLVEAASVRIDAQTRPLVIRSSKVDWSPSDVPDLVVQARLGTIITARGTDASVRRLLADPRVNSVEESRPAGCSECARSMPFIKIGPSYLGAAGPYAETGDGALIAVIDDGIDVLHRAFLDANGNSRIVGIWDQNDITGPPPKGFSYGRFHDANAIAGYLKADRVPASLGRNEGGHGTHVASIAGGRAVGQFAGGVAPDAKMLIVVSGGSGPIGYSQSHIEALAFIDDFASARNLPVVVNLSQGMNAGAHDGKSALEVAFDAFSDSGRRPGRVVVKSAGNERDKNGHACFRMKPDSLEKLRWKRASGADHSERMELWWSSADDLEFLLRDPAGEPSSSVGLAQPRCNGTFARGGPFRLLFTKRHIDNGDSLLLIELGDATAPAGPGEWLLEIRSASVPEGGEIHAWIERTQGAPSEFLRHGSEEVTLSIPATASSVIAVGAVDASKPIQLGDFSSYGPTRDGQKKPLVCAPGVKIRAAEGGTEDSVIGSSGTSMAAPHVTGGIALLLSRSAKSGCVPGGNQIASALRQRTQNYNGQWDPGQGYGVVDVAALLAAF
jgi:endonuclease G